MKTRSDDAMQNLYDEPILKNIFGIERLRLECIITFDSIKKISESWEILSHGIESRGNCKLYEHIDTSEKN